MSQALLIEIRGTTAGLVVGSDRSFRFFSSQPAFDALDGRNFTSIAEAQRAAASLRHRRSPRAVA